MACALVDTYSASTLGAKVHCLQSLTSRRLKPGANTIPSSIAKGRAKPIPTTTRTRAVESAGRVFLDVCGEKNVQSVGGKKYLLMIRDDFIRFNAVYFTRSKYEVSRYFRQYLADYRFTGVPCPVETVRTDDAAEFKGGAFADLCRGRGIRQDFTTADSP